MASNDTKEDVKPTKICKWDTTAVKNAVDDAVKHVLVKRLGYVENFALLDGRLVICSIAVCIAMFALLWDYLYPFPQSRPILIFSVCSYFILMGILTLYTTYHEKGIFVVCTQKNGPKDNTWSASSNLKKYDDTYDLTLSIYDGQRKAVRKTNSKKSVASYIDSDGLVSFDAVGVEITKLHNSLLSERKDK